MPPPGATLIGSSKPPTRSLMTTWAMGAGWLMSCAAYGALAGPNNPAVLLFAVPAGLLSGAAVHWAGGNGHPTGSQIVGSSVFASCLCPFTTIVPLLLFEAATGGLGPAVELLGMVICFSVIGAFLTVPFGIGFGAVFVIAWDAIDSGRARGHRSALEIAWMAFGAGWVLVGGFLALASDYLPLHRFLFDRPWSPNLIAAISTIVAALGAAVLLSGVARHLRRRRLAERARRGELPGFAVVPASEVEDAHQLPALFPSGPLDAVLVRRSAGDGPFRDGPDVPVARLAR